MKKRHQQKLIFLSFILFLGLNFPIILLADSSTPVLGIPATLFYVFVWWLIGSVLSFIILHKYYE